MASDPESRQDLAPSGSLLAGLAPHPVAVLSLPGRVIRYVNPPFCALVGLTSRDLEGLRFPDSLPDPPPEGLARALEQSARERTVQRLTDVRSKDRAGAQRYRTYTAWPILAGRDHAVGLVVEVVDTTDRVEGREREAAAAAELREANEQLVLAGLRERALAREAEAARERAAFLSEASKELAASLDIEAALARFARLAVARLAPHCSIYLLEGDGSVRAFTMSQGEISLDPSHRLAATGPPFTLAQDHPVARAIRSGRREVLERPSAADLLLALDGEERGQRRRHVVGSPVALPLVARGRCLGAVSLAREVGGPVWDSTDLALAEELVHRASVAVDNARLYRESQQAVRAREEFLARASHELRTPLTSALGTVRLLARAIAGDLHETPADLLAIALRNLDAMLVLINNLLDASKLGGETEPLRRGPVGVAPAAGGALEVLAAQAREKGVELTAAVPDGLAVLADAEKLEQVLVNLLANAVKFTPPAGRVTLFAEPDPADPAGSIRIGVRDSGVGLAPEHLERVFQPFFQVAAHRGARPRGSGLGLAICRQIVQLHGGVIWAESDGPGRGSTFLVRLPAATALGGRAA